jgi:hypothetical protein
MQNRGGQGQIQKKQTNNKQNPFKFKITLNKHSVTVIYI